VLKGFISSAVKNVARNGFLLLPLRRNLRISSNSPHDSLFPSLPKCLLAVHPCPIELDGQWGFFVAFSPLIPVDLTTAADLLNMYERESSHK